MRLSKNQFCKLAMMYFLLFILSYTSGKYVVLTYVKFNTETTLPRISFANTYEVAKTCEPLEMFDFMESTEWSEVSEDFSNSFTEEILSGTCDQSDVSQGLYDESYEPLYENVCNDFTIPNNTVLDVTANGNYYTYCPAGVNTESSPVMFYCQNGADGQVIDYIYCSVITDPVQGNVALEPSVSGWDSAHVCDPTVVNGTYSYQDVVYQYAMFYLGCSTYDNQCNKIGVALSNDLKSKFIKPEHNLLLDYSYDSTCPDVFQWGIGQPSAISLGNGKVLLFYTKGDPSGTATYAVTMDLSCIENISISNPVKVSDSGIPLFISNADFAYDNGTGTLYMICDSRPFSSGDLDYIAASSDIYSTNVPLTLEALMTCDWNFLQRIDSNMTGFLRNHNCGFIRDASGYTSGQPGVLCTVANHSLWEYRIMYIP